MLVNRESYSDWARSTYNACREKHTEISYLLSHDEDAPGINVVNARVAEGERVSAMCMQQDIGGPVLAEHPTDEQMKRYMLEVKVHKVKWDEVVKTRNQINACMAFIKSRISEEMIQLVYSTPEAKDAETEMNLYEYWMAIRDAVTLRGSAKKVAAVKAATEIASMKQAAGEDIRLYVGRYSKAREQLHGYGYSLFNTNELDGIQFALSLHEGYCDLKNAVQNGIVKVATFVEAKELSLKWSVKQSGASASSEVAAVADVEIAAATGGAEGGKKKKAMKEWKAKRCYFCKGAHLIAECPKLKHVSASVSTQASP